MSGTSLRLSEKRLAELRRLHATAVANKGGAFEVDTDEDFRLAFMDDATFLIDELVGLRAAAQEFLERVVWLADNFYDDLEESPEGAGPFSALRGSTARRSREEVRPPRAPSLVTRRKAAACDALFDGWLTNGSAAARLTISPRHLSR